MLVRFGPALRADLQQVYGVDMAQLASDRRWVHLLALIDGLPANSRYVQAMYDDDEWRKMIEDSQDDDSPIPPPPLSTWSPEVNMLAQVVDSLAVVTQAIVVSNGGKSKKIKPVPRPLSEKSQGFNEDQKAVLEQFLPKET